jgi:Mor family transcriptional regulator
MTFELCYTLKKGGIKVQDYDINYLNDVYRDIGKELGIEIALKIFNMYKGTQVSFPRKLMSPNYIKQAIKSEYNGKNVKSLAIKYNISDRSVRRIINNEDKQEL